MKTYLVTGGAGFIGTNFIKYMLKKYEKKINLIVLDKLTYAGKIKNLSSEIENNDITFIKGDIGNTELVENIFLNYDIDYVVNFAAESHVDRSIENPEIFFKTNILGTQNLLEISKKYWSVGKDEKGYPIYKKNKKFIQISTDEVYGSLSKNYEAPKELILNENVKIIAKRRKNLKTFGDNFFIEKTPLDPRSPYSSSKAGADLIVLAYAETYKLPINITRCSNNYGPYQFTEKLIPLIITNILKGEKLPVYGDGTNVRDWLYVRDHNKAVDLVINNGKLGEVYNIGGFNEERNIDIVKLIIDKIKIIMDKENEYRSVLKTNLENINYNLISYVQDRLGHDKRYAIDPEKIVLNLGWYPETTFEEGIEKTIRWYLDNLI